MPTWEHNELGELEHNQVFEELFLNSKASKFHHRALLAWSQRQVCELQEGNNGPDASHDPGHNMEKLLVQKRLFWEIFMPIPIKVWLNAHSGLIADRQAHVNDCRDEAYLKENDEFLRHIYPTTWVRTLGVLTEHHNNVEAEKKAIKKHSSDEVVQTVV